MQQFKSLGLAHNISDDLLTWAGSLSSITQTIARLVSGYLYDRVGAKKIFGFIMVVNFFLALLIYASLSYPAIYFILV